MKRPRTKNAKKSETRHFIHEKEECCRFCKELCFRTMGGDYICIKCGKKQGWNATQFDNCST